ncbi:DUF3530 family protein [Paraglaciecola marina]|uniref:DUF3530 family protein n=1 Tax=Paraglaciecola marina TaxID=2500157 RepID=UPI0010612EB4
MFKYITTISLIIISFISEAAPDTQLLKRLDLERTLFSEQYEKFVLNNQDILYVMQENTTAITLGVAVMIAESGTSVIGQNGLRPLATQLNDLGWVTILMPAPDVAFLPSLQEPLKPDSPQSAEQAGGEVTESTSAKDEIAEFPPPRNRSRSVESQLNKAAFLKHEEELIALLQESATRAANYPGFFLVIAQGTSAAWMTKIYAEKRLETPDALVTISPFWPDRKLNDTLPTLIAQTPMPVLDLYSESDNEWSLQTVKHREVSAIKALKLQYRQRKMLGFTNINHSSLYLSKEIYGWTSYMGW